MVANLPEYFPDFKAREDTYEAALQPSFLERKRIGDIVNTALKILATTLAAASLAIVFSAAVLTPASLAIVGVLFLIASSCIIAHIAQSICVDYALTDPKVIVEMERSVLTKIHEKNMSAADVLDELKKCRSTLTFGEIERIYLKGKSPDEVNLKTMRSLVREAILSDSTRNNFNEKILFEEKTLEQLTLSDFSAISCYGLEKRISDNIKTAFLRRSAESGKGLAELMRLVPGGLSISQEELADAIMQNELENSFWDIASRHGSLLHKYMSAEGREKYAEKIRALSTQELIECSCTLPLRVFLDAMYYAGIDEEMSPFGKPMQKEIIEAVRGVLETELDEKIPFIERDRNKENPWIEIVGIWDATFILTGVLSSDWEYAPKIIKLYLQKYDQYYGRDRDLKDDGFYQMAKRADLFSDEQIREAESRRSIKPIMRYEYIDMSQRNRYSS